MWNEAEQSVIKLSANFINLHYKNFKVSLLNRGYKCSFLNIIFSIIIIYVIVIFREKIKIYLKDDLYERECILLAKSTTS